VGCHDGCPRLPVTAARRMRWWMVRAVIEGWLGRESGRSWADVGHTWGSLGGGTLS
jgi:hypothetical protein